MRSVGDEEVVALAQPIAVIDAIASSLRGLHEAPERLHYNLSREGAKLLIMPAWAASDWIGTKMLTIMPGNAARGLPTINGLYVLANGRTGMPLCVLGAAGLTAIRTAAVSALAARHLARRNAATLVVLGTGALAPHFVRAHGAVRTYKRIVIWGRDPSKAARVVALLAGEGWPAEIALERNSALAVADVVCAATSSTSPLIAGRALRPGTHVDLVGSFAPDMQEADSDLFRRGRLVVDTRAALEESGDLIGPVRDGVINARATPNLADLLATPLNARQDDQEITIFKAIGHAPADLAVACWVWRHLSGADDNNNASA